MEPAAPPALRVVTLRPVTNADRDLLLMVYGSTRDDELSQVAWPPGQREAFVRQQFETQDLQYRQLGLDASFDVVEVDGRPAGRLYVDRRTTEIRVVDIALLPQFRGSGTGTELLGRLMGEAAASGRRLSLHVEIHNPAARLYERLGFVVVGERGLHRLMEWPAS